MKIITLRGVRGAAVDRWLAEAIGRPDTADRFAAMVTETTKAEETAIAIDRNPRTLTGIGYGSLGACARLGSLVRIGSYRIRKPSRERARKAGDECDQRRDCGDPREVGGRATLLGEARVQHCFAD